MLRPFIKKWRGQGIRCVIYIDDGIHGSSSKKSTAYHCLTVRDDLENAGFMLNEEKTRLYPSQLGLQSRRAGPEAQQINSVSREGNISQTHNS